MDHHENALQTGVERRDIRDYTESMINAAEKVIESLKRSVSDARISLNHDEESVEYLFKSPSEHLSDICSELLSSLRRNTVRMHQVAVTAPPSTRNYEFTEHIFTERDTSLPTEERVFVQLENIGIFVRMPMLWGANFRMKNNKVHMETLVERDDIFASAVRQGILTAPSYDHFDTSRYIEKTVHFLYVYPISGRYGTLAVDNANHLIKGVLDAATMFLPGGDSPFSCSVYSSAVHSDEVVSGTYLTILPGRDKLMSSEKILSFWHGKQEKMPKTMTENSNFNA